MRVLVGCEESQAVCKAFRELGHEAYSCDLKPCSGGHPEWHIHGDVLESIGDGWDFFGAHPVCKYLTNSGVGWLARTKPTKGYVWDDHYGVYMNWERHALMVDGAEFFNKMLDAVECIGAGYVENPIMHRFAKEIVTRTYTQIIQPWMFGHPESKATCMWIVGLPPLVETYNVKDLMNSLPKKDAQRLHYLSPGPERDTMRSKTFPGIAKAMADQWGKYDKSS